MTILGEQPADFWRDVFKSILTGLITAVILALIWRKTPLKHIKG